MAIPKLQVTKDYRLFARSVENRPLCPEKHKRLRKSMEKRGFLPCFPVACHRNGDKHLIVDDGQHRIAFAETLGLPVYYTVLDDPLDIAEVNSTTVIWVTRNFAEKFAANGKKAYVEGLEFADRHGIPVGTAFCLLAGTFSWSNISRSYYDGDFKIVDRAWAEAVATIYAAIVHNSARCRSARLIEAVMAVTRVEKFDVQRMLANVDRCREKLVPFATKEAYLDMLETVYNYGRKTLVGLKVAAINAMRERNAAKLNG